MPIRLVSPLALLIAALLAVALLALAACSSTADPIGIGGGANDLKRSKCAGAAGSPCKEITAPPLDGPALDRWRNETLRQIG